jgi:hypothetical protein
MRPRPDMGWSAIEEEEEEVGLYIHLLHIQTDC